jgi:hypothetical protein
MAVGIIIFSQLVKLAIERQNSIHFHCRRKWDSAAMERILETLLGAHFKAQYIVVTGPKSCW